MCVRRSHNIRACFVDLRMNQEPSFINRQLSSAVDDEPISIQKNEIRSLDSREMPGERVHPEMVLKDRVCKPSEYSSLFITHLTFKIEFHTYLASKCARRHPPHTLACQSTGMQQPCAPSSTSVFQSGLRMWECHGVSECRFGLHEPDPGTMHRLPLEVAEVVDLRWSRERTALAALLL